MVSAFFAESVQEEQGVGVGAGFGVGGRSVSQGQTAFLRAPEAETQGSLAPAPGGRAAARMSAFFNQASSSF